MLKLETFPNSVSEDERFIAGIRVHVDNLKSVEDYVKRQVSHEILTEDIRINVLYLVHHRGGDYTYTKSFGHRIIKEFSKKSDAPMLAISFDARNHGERQIDQLRNTTWSSNNESHALDMVSSIDGTVEDLKLIIQYLPVSLDFESSLTAKMKESEVKIKYNNIISGYSLGGHVVIRFANRYPDLTSLINPNIGCADMTSLLINRLKGTSSFEKKLFYSTYEELGLSDSEKKKYPEALHEKVSAEDVQIFESFPFSVVKIFASFYDEDPNVPPQITKLWLDLYLNSNSKSESFFEKGKFHGVTENMLDKFASWLTQNI